MTDQEIQKFIDETKATMDAAPNEEGPVFNAGLDSICAFIAPLNEADLHRWIQLLVATYKSNPLDDHMTQSRSPDARSSEAYPGQERLQLLNQKLAAREEFKAALTRYHAWKETKPPVLNARHAAESLANRIDRGEPVEEVIEAALEAKAQFASDPAATEAFEIALRTVTEPRSDAYVENFRVLKARVLDNKEP